MMLRKGFGAALIFVVLGSPAISQPDPLRFFDGIWFQVNPPGPQITFNRVGGNLRQANLAILGATTITVSDGRDGSNLKVSGAGFDCYYLFGMIGAAGREMAWDLKSGDAACPKSALYKKDPP